MQYQYFKPPIQLAELVRYFWILDFDQIAPEEKEFRVFGRRYPRLVFQHDEGKSAIRHGHEKLPLAYVGGLNTRSYTCRISPTIRTTGVSFHPHGMKVLFGVDCHLLVNELPDLINFVPRDVIERVLESPKVNQRVQIISDYLTERLQKVRSNPLSLFGWRMVTAFKEDMLVTDLADLFNVSPRQLARNFYQTVGMSPKQFLRISRFEKSIDLLQKSVPGNLANLAYELHFSDQSHFIREFRAFSDLTPLQYLDIKKIHEENSAIMIR